MISLILFTIISTEQTLRVSPPAPFPPSHHVLTH
jgi:hypothetical protein